MDEVVQVTPRVAMHAGLGAQAPTQLSVVERGEGMKKFVSLCGPLAFLCVLVVGPSIGSAQPLPESLEPLPTDPAKRVFFGEYYSPEEYTKCLERRAKENQDPRIDGCYAYRERLEPLDPTRRDHFGEFYDPAKYHECRSKVEEPDTQCEYLKLRRIVQREIWPHDDVPKPKLPEALNPPVYKWHMRHMNAKRYFDALCKAEAGEFIYKTVDNVDGVYQIRPRAGADDYGLRDRYVLEDPYGFTQAEANNAPAFFVGPKRYRFFEVPVERERIRDQGLDGKYFDASIFLRPAPSDKVARYFGSDDRSVRSLKKEYDTKLRSRYGYTWRGIKRPKDREHGIAGGELIVLDLTTSEVLGIRRGFMLASKSRISASGLNWESGIVCPKLTDRRGWSKDVDFTAWFVTKVLRPMRQHDGGRDAGQRK